MLLQAATPERRLSLPDSAPEEEEPPLRALFTDSSGDLPAPCPSAALALAEAARTEGDTTADEARSHCGGSMSDASAPSPRGSCPQETVPRSAATSDLALPQPTVRRCVSFGEGIDLQQAFLVPDTHYQRAAKGEVSLLGSLLASIGVTI